MSFDNIIDIESLLQPISEDAPTGEDIRADRSPSSDYYTIKDARNNARAAERSSMFDEDVDLLKPWRTVAEVAPKILSSKSKDLEVACWYTEGLIRLHGVSGLRDGIKLIHGLVLDHWEGLYPEPDEDGIETKVAPLTGLNGDGGDGTLMAPIRNMSITNEGDYGSFNLWQYQKARDNSKLTDDDERAARNEALGFSFQDVEATIQEASPQFYVDMVETLEETQQDYKALNELLRSSCGSDTPPSSNITNLLDEVLRSVRFLSKDKLDQVKAATEAQQAVDEPTADDDTPSVSAAAQAVVVNQVAGPIGNREDALKRLEEVADYFRKNEPHTPLAPGIERLISWGRMTVAELMMELLPEDSSRGFFSQLTGVKLDGSDDKKYVPPAPTPSASSPSPQASSPAEEPVTEEPAPSVGW
ncbi:type VI secretion system protein TssA [Aestuariicella sp. G3-2]|uniref:type VI secretion system protein TssA n=1 Tax=Pseudomaricurvus albidus TaxID=2842452 RepID=UPI001C0B9CB7|nr:type VI secretion system protein TssA [Aestuariicella albida]MBU3070342.1 type VI secretion system protein TssA [Aestuariicella albida]